MMEYESYQDFLKAELLKRTQLNPRYSQRAFANLLGLSPGALSEILKGKRKLTYKAAKKIALALNLNKNETEDFLKLIDIENGETPPEKDIESTQLTKDIFEIVSNWYCFAILNLADTEGFRWNYAYIAKRLGIGHFQAKDAIERMIKVGLIKETKNGLKASEELVISPDGVPSRAIRQYHHSMLEKAQEALETQPIDKRDIRGASMAINPKYLDKIRKEVFEFQKQLVDKYGSEKGKKTEVYHLETALFSLTQIEE